MTFTIDTGTAVEINVFRVDREISLLDAVHDRLGADATQSQIDDLLVQYITGELRAPKTLKTIRRRLLQYWPLISPLAEREPEMFDSLILEVAELIS